MEPFAGLENELTERVIRVFYQVATELGFGFFESIYEEAMLIAFRSERIRAESQVPVPVSFRGQVVGVFKADILVESRVILELKVAEAITKAHEAQLRHYLRVHGRSRPHPQFR